MIFINLKNMNETKIIQKQYISYIKTISIS